MGYRQPVGTGTLSSDESREARFDIAACDRYYRQIGKEPGVAGICGLCLYVCPHSRKKGKGVPTSPSNRFSGQQERKKFLEIRPVRDYFPA